MYKSNWITSQGELIYNTRTQFFSPNSCRHFGQDNETETKTAVLGTGLCKFMCTFLSEHSKQSTQHPEKCILLNPYLEVFTATFVITASQKEAAYLT